MLEEQAGKCIEPQKWGPNPKFPQNGAVPGIAAQPGKVGEILGNPKKTQKSSPLHPRGREHEKPTSRGEEGDAEGGKGCGGGSEGSAVARLWSDAGVLVLTGWPQKPGGRSCLGRRVDEAPD